MWEGKLGLQYINDIGSARGPGCATPACQIRARQQTCRCRRGGQGLGPVLDLRPDAASSAAGDSGVVVVGPYRGDISQARIDQPMMPPRHT